MSSISPKNIKICTKFGVQRLSNDFNFRSRAKGTRHSYCRDCGKVLTRSRYSRNKQQYFDKNSRSYEERCEFRRKAKARPCVDCGVQHPFFVMDFDHREGQTKKFELN